MTLVQENQLLIILPESFDIFILLYDYNYEYVWLKVGGRMNIHTCNTSMTEQKRITSAASAILFIFVCVFINISTYLAPCICCTIPGERIFLQALQSFIKYRTVGIYPLFYYPPALFTLSINHTASIFWCVGFIHFFSSLHPVRINLRAGTYISHLYSRLIVDSPTACASQNEVASRSGPLFEKLSNTSSHPSTAYSR